MYNLLDRFLSYVRTDTQSDPDSALVPSTEKQTDFLKTLADEFDRIGLSGIKLDRGAYLYGFLPATTGWENTPRIGFIAHADTSPDLSGHGVNPLIHNNYDGNDIVLKDGTVISPRDFPELASLAGDTLITADGNTLLGADDKAGIAIILTAIEELLSRGIPHGPVSVAITTDEEIGRGADHFDVAGFRADYAFTVDGGALGELEYENFNAASAKLTFRGRNIHPGDAEGKMLNSLRLAMEFEEAMPPDERPENTSGRQGFIHLTDINGTVEQTVSQYIIRDHDPVEFDSKKRLMEESAAKMNDKYPNGEVICTITEQYRNMHEIIIKYPQIIEQARAAMRRCGVVPVEKPIRGGTDGARLSFMGLPCPNLFTGGANFHGRHEYCSLDSMKKAVETVINIVRKD